MPWRVAGSISGAEIQVPGVRLQDTYARTQNHNRG